MDRATGTAFEGEFQALEAEGAGIGAGLLVGGPGTKFPARGMIDGRLGIRVAFPQYRIPVRRLQEEWAARIAFRPFRGLADLPSRDGQSRPAHPRVRRGRRSFYPGDSGWQGIPPP